jgi:hypothetical protein
MKRLWLIVPWALFALAALGWVGYWFYLAGEAENRLRAWAGEQNAAGAEVTFGRVVRHGFPVLLRLELQDVAYVAARGGWRGQTARADLHIEPLNPGHVILEAKTPIALTREDGAVTNVNADTLIASMRTADNALVMAGVEADNLVLDDPAQEGVLYAAKVVANVRPDPRAAGEYQLAFEARALTLPRPVRSFETFGLDIGELRAAIVVEQGAALLQSGHGDPLGPWREAGGRLRLEALTLNWGPLETTGNGAGGLDEGRRLTGALEIPIERPAPVLTAIANGPNVNADARRALSLLAAGYAISGDDITLDVEARDGVLRLEGLPVRSLGPVY